jgi:hypothetical protein
MNFISDIFAFIAAVVCVLGMIFQAHRQQR